MFVDMQLRKKNEKATLVLISTLFKIFDKLDTLDQSGVK